MDFACEIAWLPKREADADPLVRLHPYQQGQVGMTIPRDPDRKSARLNLRSGALWRLLPLAMCAMLATTGCGDTTGPTEPTKPVVKPEPLLPDRAMLSGLIVESLERVVPTLREGAAREDMTAALGQLSLVVETKTVTYVRVALNAADASVTRYESILVDESSALAELSGIRLILDLIASELAALAGK